MSSAPGLARAGSGAGAVEAWPPESGHKVRTGSHNIIRWVLAVTIYTNKLFVERANTRPGL